MADTPPSTPTAEPEDISIFNQGYRAIELWMVAISNQLGLTGQSLSGSLATINKKLTAINQELEKIMATQADLAAAQAALDQAVQTLGADVQNVSDASDKAFADLLAQVKLLQAGQPVDIQSMLASIQKIQDTHNALLAIAQAATTDDPGPQGNLSARAKK